MLATNSQSAILDTEKLDSIAASNDPNVALSLGNLATLYMAQERYTDAEQVWARVLKIRRDSLGEQHPEVARTLQSIAQLYSETGRYANAEAAQTEVVQIYSYAYGNEHSITATALNTLAGIYLKQAKYGEAAPLIEEVLRIRRSTLRPMDADDIPILENLRSIYEHAGDVQKVNGITERLNELRRKFKDSKPNDGKSGA